MSECYMPFSWIVNPGNSEYQGMPYHTSCRNMSGAYEIKTPTGNFFISELNNHEVFYQKMDELLRLYIRRTCNVNTRKKKRSTDNNW